jgi:hypothetical protein
MVEEEFKGKFHVQENRLHQAKGITRVMSGRTDLAVADFEEAVRVSMLPTDASQNLGFLARALKESGQTKRAHTMLQKCVRTSVVPQVTAQCKQWLAELPPQ